MTITMPSQERSSADRTRFAHLALTRQITRGLLRRQPLDCLVVWLKNPIYIHDAWGRLSYRLSRGVPSLLLPCRSLELHGHCMHISPSLKLGGFSDTPKAEGLEHW